MKGLREIRLANRQGAGPQNPPENQARYRAILEELDRARLAEAWQRYERRSHTLSIGAVLADRER